MAMQILGAKRSYETITRGIDFSSLLIPGETITTASSSAAVWSGTGALPTLTSAVGTGYQVGTVQVMVTGGTAGTVYRMTTTAVTSYANTLAVVSYLAVVDDPV